MILSEIKNRVMVNIKRIKISKSFVAKHINILLCSVRNEDDVEVVKNGILYLSTRGVNFLKRTSMQLYTRIVSSFDSSTTRLALSEPIRGNRHGYSSHSDDEISNLHWPAEEFNIKFIQFMR